MHLRKRHIAAASLISLSLVAAPAIAQDSNSSSASSKLKAPKNKKPQTDWTKRVRQSKIGGHVMGNPLAKSRIAEYVSYTCNHCATFEAQSTKLLRSKYIASGKISMEVRNLARDPVDLTVAMLARCGGKKRFFELHNSFLVTQSTWLSRSRFASRPVQQSWYAGDFASRHHNISTFFGFYGIMETLGFSREKVKKCFAKEKERKKILAMTEHAQKNLRITGTPGFTINDKVIKKVHDWNRLKPVLENALNPAPPKKKQLQGKIL